jgi:hypothetical protein
VKTCKECGTTLADRAMYCMQCGTPVGPAGSTESVSGNADFVRPALIAGTVLGVLSAIPIVNLGNCICCMWVVGGGGFGAWLLGKDYPGGPGALSFGDGAFVGVWSGLVGGLVATALSIPLRLMASGAGARAELEDMLLDLIPNIDPETLETILQFADFSLLSVVVTLLSNVILYSLFAMIGGILLVAIMGKKAGTPAVTSPPASE